MKEGINILSLFYTRISVPVPQPLGLTDIPPFIYFDVDNRFTEQQRGRIISIISTVLFDWKTHYDEKWNGGANNGISRWAACSNKYATRNLRPAWGTTLPINNGQQALELAMDTFTLRIRENGFRRVPTAKIRYRIPPPGGSSTIRGITVFRRYNVTLSVTINPELLDSPALTNILLAGSLTHAWLHRSGWYHPKDTSYFIAEAPMCEMRNFMDKVPTQPDNIFIQFFD